MGPIQFSKTVPLPKPVQNPATSSSALTATCQIRKDCFFPATWTRLNRPTESEVLRTGDIFTSKGETVLGGDDKSGIAAILELLALLTGK